MSFSSEQLLFLINPNSGQKNHEKIIASLQKADRRLNYYISKSKDDLASFFSDINPNYKVVVICGGDGTVNSILKYAINTDLIFAVLPHGSGNGFAREMGYVKNLEKMLVLIKKGETRRIDVIKINGNYCCNIAGIGFDSYIAQQFDKSGKRGLSSYLKESLKGFFRFPKLDAKIVADTIHLNGNYFMLTIANTRQFGNNVIIAPKALPNDGLLDLVAIKTFPKILAPQVFLNLLYKKGKDSKYIQYIKAKRIVIETSYCTYHIDGEPLELNNTALSATIENTINFIV